MYPFNKQFAFCKDNFNVITQQKISFFWKTDRAYEGELSLGI